LGVLLFGARSCRARDRTTRNHTLPCAMKCESPLGAMSVIFTVE
jgi:hypothetical protein